MKKTMILLFSCLLLMMLCNTNVAQSTNDNMLVDTGTLVGQVTDTFGQPIRNATITVRYHDETIHIGMTNEKGRYIIEEISLCKCLKTVACRKIGYEPVVVEIAINELTVQNFVLE